jgi:hypothetical protein
MEGCFSMRRCSGNNTEKWGFEAIFEKTCPGCGMMMEFFKDEIRRTCPACRKHVFNHRKDQGCGQWCSANSEHMRNICPKFSRSKRRWRKW